MGNVLCHIRFLAMSIDEFETGTAISGILTEEEIDIIKTNIANIRRYEKIIPMPLYLSNAGNRYWVWE